MGREMIFDATSQALNFVIQSSGSPIGESSVRFQDMNDYQTGQTHLRSFKDIARSPRLVKLLVAIPFNRGEFGFGNWLVKDVLTGLTAKVPQNHLSKKSYNELEVLAWASR